MQVIKRTQIVPGFVVKVSKKMPDSVPAGPRFTGNLGLNEKLEISGVPRNSGGLNLVPVIRLKTGEQTEVIYAFITNFCSPA
jgi:hypothetical protein